MDNRQHSKKNVTGKGQSTKEFRSKVWLEMLDPVKSYRRTIAAALHPSYYQGTADAKAVAKRRAKNKVARRSRRINRQRA